MGGQQGGDCSDRFCPYELAWVDSPDKTGSTHNYAECAAKGICDRELGECECMAGFEGKGCARQTCMDGCSGHGKCEFMEELTFGTVYNDYYDASTTAYNGVGVGAVRPSKDYSWDVDRARACVCDAGWTGINCAARMCPSGNDIMDLRQNTVSALVYQVQTITLYSGGTDGGQTTGAVGAKTFTSGGAADLVSRSFALTFTSKTNETFTTVPVELASADTAGYNDLKADIQSALLDLPNKVITGVVATVSSFELVSGKGIKIAVTFNGDSVHGKQNLLEVSTAPCGEGCTPRVDGLDVLVTNTNTTSNVQQTTAADYNSYICGRRGKCDYDLGLCSCFEGYTGEACSDITALV
jgi:hypothetical protein